MLTWLAQLCGRTAYYFFGAGDCCSCSSSFTSFPTSTRDGCAFLRMVFTLPTVREQIPARSAIFSRTSIDELCANLPNPCACHQRSGWQCGSVTQVLLLNADVAVGYTWPRLILSISAIVQSLASLALLPDSRARALLISAGRIQILANKVLWSFRSHK